MNHERWNYPKPSATAVHELSHAAIATLLGARVRWVSIEPPCCAMHHLGTTDDQEAYERDIAIALAGRAGDELFFGIATCGDSADVVQVRGSALRLCNGDVERARLVIAKLRARVCLMLLAANRELLELSLRLMREKTLTGQEIRKALRGVKWPPRRIKKRRAMVDPYELELFGGHN